MVKITEKIVGRRIRRPWWKASAEWYRIKMVGNNIVVAADQDGREVIFNRDETDKDWVLLGDEITDFPLAEGA